VIIAAVGIVDGKTRFATMFELVRITIRQCEDMATGILTVIADVLRMLALGFAFNPGN
jgi:hypothetical protein